MTIIYARKLLGSTSRSMSDPQVQDLLNQFYGLAEIIAGIVNGSKNINRGIEPNPRKADNGNN